MMHQTCWRENLSGVDGMGMGLFMHHKALGRSSSEIERTLV